jgi:hypothetical protein
MSVFPADLLRGWSARSALIAASGALLVGIAGYALGHMRASGQVTHLTIATCGLGDAPAPVALPLRDLMRKAGGHNVSLGPFRHAGLERDVTVRFALGSDTPRRLSDGEDADLLVLPLPALDAPLPDEIRLECRYGAVARVQYRKGTTREAFDLTAPPAMAESSAG